MPQMLHFLLKDQNLERAKELVDSKLKWKVETYQGCDKDH
jgi:hypothetical protein